MKVSIENIIECIENFAPSHLEEAWDNSGFQVCPVSTKTSIDLALVALDPSPKALEKAIELDCKLLITHHPLSIEGIKSVTTQSAQGSVIIEAIKHGITIYSTHTPFDIAEGGINDKLAEILNLKNITHLDQHGLGRVGELEEPLSTKDFAEELKKIFSLPTIRTNGTDNQMIRRVALCGGSGASLIESARSSGADCYLCGDLKYHNYGDSGNLILFDIGHFESEKIFNSIINSLLSEFFTNFAVHSLDSNYTRLL